MSTFKLAPAKTPRLLSPRILTFVQVKVFKCRGRQMPLAMRAGGDHKKYTCGRELDVGPFILCVALIEGQL